MERAVDTLARLLFGSVIVTGLAFLAVPVAIALIMSFDARDYLGQFPPPALSLKWYIAFFSNPYYIDALWNSVVIGLLTAITSTVLGVCGALVLDRYDFPGLQLLSALFLSPLVVPTVIVGFAILLFFSAIGIFDGYIRLLCGHLIITLPYTIRTTLSSLVGIRPTLVEAAMSLGATEREAFWSVTFPLAKTGIVAGAIFALSISLDDLALSLFLVDPFSTTLPVALLTGMRVQFNLTIAAASGLMLAVTAGLVLLLDRLIGLDRLVGTGVYRA